MITLVFLVSTADAGKDYYKVLGVSRKADEKQLKRAYKKQAMKWHPDKHQEDKDKATTKFQEIAEAYETLSDTEKRKLYDLGGEEAVKGQPPSGQDRAGSRGHTSFTSQQGAGGDGRAQWFYSQEGPSDDVSSNIDPRVLQDAFAKMFGGQSGSGKSGSSRQFFGSMPGGIPASDQRSRQGGPLFTRGPVKELSFKDHEAQIQALTKHGPAVVLFYAAGGSSCPELCHRIKKEYLKLAEAQQAKVAITAVQCKRRRGRCAEYANSFPAIVLFEKGTQSKTVLSAGIAARASLLQQKMDALLVKKHGGMEELTPDLWLAGDPCEGQFCLLLLERGSENSALQARRKALAAAAKRLRGEPIRTFYVKADKFPNFVRSFETRSPSAFLGGFLRMPAAQVILYRPKRQRFEVFEGDMENAEALAEFAEKTINRGTPLSQKTKGEPHMEN